MKPFRAIQFAYYNLVAQPVGHASSAVRIAVAIGHGEQKARLADRGRFFGVCPSSP